MKHYHLHEFAKFAAGLVVGDFFGLLWISTHGGLPTTFLGAELTSSIILPALTFDAVLFLLLVHYAWNIGKMPILRERGFLLLSALVFGIVALAHLVRVFTGAGVVVLGWSVPLWLSWAGTAGAAYLSYMSLRLSAKAR